MSKKSLNSDNDNNDDNCPIQSVTAEASATESAATRHGDDNTLLYYKISLHSRRPHGPAPTRRAAGWARAALAESGF